MKAIMFLSRIYSKFLPAMCFFSVLFYASCSKDGDINGGGMEGNLTSLPGTIYYDWATEGIMRVHLAAASGGAFIPDNTKLNSFDVSRDGQERLTVMNESTVGDYPIRFTLSSMANNSVIDEFVYRSPGLNAFCKGFLSPDKSLIMILSNNDEDGITIVRRNGEVVARLLDINGEAFDFNETRLWLPENRLLITHKNYIIRIDPPYNNGTLVREMKYDDWGDLNVNNAGNQMVVRIGNHLHTMDFQSGDPVKITESNFKEAEPHYSPDDKHILVGSNYRQTGPFGYIWELKVIPNDGKTYNVDPNATNTAGVIPIIWRNNKVETAGGQVLWR